MSVPNQKIIYGSILAPCDTENIYMKINQEAAFAAMGNLTYAGFKMWLYFSKNQSTHRFELSRTACQQYNIDKNNYYRGVEELIQKRYLVAASDNGYYFYQVPIKDDS